MLLAWLWVCDVCLLVCLNWCGMFGCLVLVEFAWFACVCNCVWFSVVCFRDWLLVLYVRYVVFGVYLLCGTVRFVVYINIVWLGWLVFLFTVCELALGLGFTFGFVLTVSLGGCFKCWCFGWLWFMLWLCLTLIWLVYVLVWEFV